MWIKPRHRFFYHFLRPLFFIILQGMYGLRNKKHRLKKRPHLILFNHQTNLDAFVVGQSVGPNSYYMASEDIFNIKYWSFFIKYITAPIPKSKSSRDLQAIKDCIRIVREGGNVGIAAEGNRTYTGKTCYIEPSVVKLVKLLKIPLCFYVMSGGYGVEPRWANERRRGKMYGSVTKIIYPEEYLKLSNEKLYDIIVKELYVDDYIDNRIYKAKRNAEFLERILYKCPVCGEIESIYSEKKHVYCRECGLTVEYTDQSRFVTDNKKFKFETVLEWWEFQENYIRSIDIEKTNISFFDEAVTLRHSIRNKTKNDLVTSNLTMNNNELKIGDYLFPIKDIDGVTVLGRNKMNFYYKNMVYQFKGSTRFNPIKYMQLYFQIKNTEKGVVENGFLGI